MALGRLSSVSLDCSDPATLARFWADVLGGEIGYDSESFVAVRTDRGWLGAVRVDNYRAPTWNDDATPKQIHLDLQVDDLDQAQEEMVRLGARVVDDQPSPDLWRVLLDPAGHPFCLWTQTLG